MPIETGNLKLNPIQIDNPLEAYGKVLSLRNMMQQNQANQMTMKLNQMKLKQLEQDMQDGQTVRDILDKYDGDVDRAKPEILSTLGERGSKFIQSVSQMNEAISKANLAQLNEMDKRFDLIGSAAGSVMGNPETYPQVKAGLEQAGLLPKGMLPDVYPGDNIIQQFIDSTIPVKDQIANRRQAAMDEETKRHNKATEENKNITPFMAWREDNPGEPVSTWIDMNKDKPDTNLSKVEMAMMAARGDETAKRALQLLNDNEAAPKLITTKNEKGEDVQMFVSPRVGSQYPMGSKSDKPPTTYENESFKYWLRGQDAEKVLDDLDKVVSNYGLFNQTMMNYAPNIFLSETMQMYNQAQRQFTEARLRKDSGAAIPESEFENDRRMYFVQPGDSKDVIKRKQKARKIALSALAKASGKAYEQSFGEAPPDIRDVRDKSESDQKINTIQTGPKVKIIKVE